MSVDTESRPGAYQKFVSSPYFIEKEGTYSSINIGSNHTRHLLSALHSRPWEQRKYLGVELRTRIAESRYRLTSFNIDDMDNVTLVNFREWIETREGIQYDYGDGNPPPFEQFFADIDDAFRLQAKRRKNPRS